MINKNATFVEIVSYLHIYQLIYSQCTLSLSPENIRKPESFLMFSGGSEKVHWKQMG